MQTRGCGLLLAFEGIDGAGKRTWADFVEEQLKSQGLSTAMLRYPDYTSPWGKIIKQYLDGELELDPAEQFFTYLTDIFKDQIRIKNLLSQGVFVLADRYFASTVAFQSAKGFDRDLALDIINASKPAIPDFSFFIEVEITTAMRRCIDRNSLDRHERDYELLDNVAKLYRRITEEKLLAKRWVIVDGNKELETLKAFMKDEMAEIMRSYRNQLV